VDDLGLKLSENGILLIQIPNASLNPFDFIISDHISHFYPSSIMKLIQESCLKLQGFSTNTISKEITLILGKKLHSTNLINSDE
jgi:hypothetical protein